ncbi:MAG: hypothetical protein KZQ93_05430 [Candidatus Thiodiazotropha sp. (ex Monitilora ramsayi)]|nr:hypothetical protein [Candidatus Thiodiazotropha sp. (ex Monitilora ramsayi)]
MDSEIARYYLENYLKGNNRNKEMDKRILQLYNQSKQSIPSREALKVISQNYSVDFASLFLADRLLSIDCNKKLNKHFLHHLNNRTTVNYDTSSYLVLFVPGWDYAEIGHLTGADFAKPRKLATEFGLENYFVELPPTGGVVENAEVLSEYISRHSHSGKEILLVGASSAGPAIHLALSNRFTKNEQNDIKAWLNIGGILQGSPIIDRYQTWPRRLFFNLVVWYKGWDKEEILSMSTNQSRKRFSRLQIDPDILVINYLGIPLSGQISRYSRDNYPLLRADGPNDGLTLLTDAIAPDSLTIVALGSDHFFAEDPRIDEKTVALMKLLISYLGNDMTADCGG